MINIVGLLDATVEVCVSLLSPGFTIHHDSKLLMRIKGFRAKAAKAAWSSTARAAEFSPSQKNPLYECQCHDCC